MLQILFLLSSTLALLIFPLATAYSADTNSGSLPEPLTLESALALIDQQHPTLRFSNANLEISRSNLQQVLSTNDLNISLKVDARWIEPSSLSINQKKEDHRAGLFINKTLYDFGRSSSQIDVATQQVLSNDFEYIESKQRQYISVMQRYFNVVLADLQFYRYNEEMAVAYIQFDRIRIRQKLGQHTEVEVAEKEVEYNKIRRLRSYSQNQQRVTRSLLAQALNKPNNLPVTVAKPKIDINFRKSPEIDHVQKIASENNPVLRSLRAQLTAAKNNIQFVQADYNPTLTGEFEGFSYEREIGSSDEWRATITLDVPLWSGARSDSSVAKAKALVYKVEAQLAEHEFLVQQQVLELLLGIETLKIKHEEATAAMNFTELSLDRNRALYELEVKADLGYSMVRFSEAERDVVQVGFDIALSWAQLDALTGILLNNKK